MKKKLLVTCFALFCAVVCALGLVACGEKPSASSHEHSYRWVDNGDGTHKQHCSIAGCDAPDIGSGNHEWGPDDKCEKCKAVKPADTQDPHEHSHVWSESRESNDTHHWHECTADGCTVADDSQKNGYAEHDFTNGDCICGKPAPHSHVWSESWESNDTYHWHECTADGCDITDNSTKDGYAEHVFEHHLCVDCAYDLSTQNLAYKLSADEKSYTVSGMGTATADDVVVPVTYEDLPVTGIEPDAFKNLTTLKSIELRENIKEIGKGAFAGCNNLQSIILPFVGAWSDSADNGCLGYIFGGNDYSDNGESVPGSLKSVIVLGGKNIAEKAFYGCTDLTEIVLPDTIETMGANAFDKCSGLESLTLPFVGATPKATEESETTYLGYVFGTENYEGSLAGYHNALNYNRYYYPIKLNNVTVLGGSFLAYAFPRHNTTYIDFLSNVTIVGDGNTEIGEHALCWCSVKNLKIGSGVKAIGKEAISYCGDLRTVSLSYGLETIGEDAFKYSGILDITIPASVKSVGARAFSNCELMTRMTIEKGAQGVAYNLGLPYSCVIFCEDSEPPKSWDESWQTYSRYSLVDIVWDCENNCSEQDGLLYYPTIDGIRYRLGIKSETATVLYSPDSSDSISLKIPETVTFDQKTYTVVEIRKNAFYGYTELTDLSVPSTLTSASSGWLNGSLASLKYNEYDNALYVGNQDDPYMILVRAKNTEITSCTIHPSARYIVDGFADCTKLQSIVLPNRITSIPSRAFEYCTALKSVTIPDSVTSIGDRAFEHCESLTSVIIPDSVTTINSSVFAYCKALQSVTIPASITAIYMDAFVQCNSLTRITFKGTTTQWNAIKGEKDSWDFSTGNYTVYCTDGTVKKQ